MDSIGDVIPETKESFLATIEMITKDLDPIATRQEEISISLYSRSSPLGKIQEEHSKWSQELRGLSQRIKACQNRIKQQSEQLLILTDVSTIKTGHVLVAEFERKIYLIEQKNNKLQLLFDSAEHRKAFTLYKDIVSKCESDKTQVPALRQRVFKEIGPQKEAIIHFNPILKDAIELLQAETIGFLSYAEGKQNLKQAIVSTQLNQQQAAYFLTFQQVKLKASRCFQSTSWRWTRSSNVSQSILQIQEIAKGLQKTELSVEKEIKDRWQVPHESSVTNESTEIYGGCLSKLKSNLAILKGNLYCLPFEKEVNSLIDYAASLSAWISEIEESLDFFNEITALSWRNVIAIHYSLYDNLRLSLASDSTSLDRIDAFYYACRLIESASKISKNDFLETYRKRTLSNAAVILSRMTGKLFPLSTEEQQIENSVIAGDTLEKESHFQFNSQQPMNRPHRRTLWSIESIVKKYFVQHEYYTQNKIIFCLPLDLFWTALSTQKIHKEYLKESMKPPVTLPSDNNELFTEETQCIPLHAIMEKYIGISFLKADFPLLFILNEVQRILQCIVDNQKNPLFVFTLYAMSQQKLLEAQKKMNTPLSQGRLDGFLEAHKKRFTIIKANYHFPDYCNAVDAIIVPDEIPTTRNLQELEPILYKQILQALWAENPNEKKQAQEDVDQLLKTNTTCNFLSDHLIQLLKELAIQRYSFDTRNDCLTIKTYLPRFLATYIENPANFPERDAETVECILYHLLHNEPEIAQHPDLQEALKKHRNDLNPFFADWKTIVSQFISRTPQTTELCSIQFSLFEEKHSEVLQNNAYYSIRYMNFLKRLTQEEQ